jgi:hypothetical protein
VTLVIPEEGFGLTVPVGMFNPSECKLQNPAPMDLDEDCESPIQGDNIHQRFSPASLEEILSCNPPLEEILYNNRPSGFLGTANHR